MGQLGAQLGNPGIQGGANGQSQYFPPVQAAGPSTPGQNPPTMLGEQDNAPTQSKGHKLLQILGAGLQGALAGRAAQEQMIAQTGGRRAGGVGTGFEAGFMLPWQRAQMAGQLAQQQAQTGLLQSEAQTTNIPGVGPVPGWLAKTMGPAWLRQQGQLGSAQIGAGAKEQAATTGANARVQAAQIGGSSRIQAAQLGLGPVAQVPPELQQQFGLPAQLPLKMLNQAEEAANKPLTTVQGANDAYTVNRQNNQKTPLGVGSPRIAAQLAGPIEVADPDNPGQTKIISKGSAIQSGAAGAQSGSVQTAKAAEKAEVPTKIGDKKIAFQTMLDHATLLRTAARALKNGDSRTLAGLANKFNTEFGSPDVTNFDAIANAYNHEVTDVVAKGHVTDGEVAKGGATLPSNANLDTIDKVLDSYEALAKSKMKNLNTQKQNAVNQAQPNKGAQQSGRRVIDFTK